MKGKDIRHRFIELRAGGWSFTRIAAELKVAKSTLIQWSKDSAEELSNLRAIESDALIEACRLGREHRLQLMGAMLDKIRLQIEARNFADVPTDKLVDMALKLSGFIDQVASPAQFSETQIKTDGELSIDSFFTKRTEKWTA